MSVINLTFIEELAQSYANYWLNALILKARQARDPFFKGLYEAGVMSRPVWRLMNEFTMFHCQLTNLTNAEWLEERVVNISSSPGV